jgi:hypothetical protein
VPNVNIPAPVTDTALDGGDFKRPEVLAQRARRFIRNAGAGGPLPDRAQPVADAPPLAEAFTGGDDGDGDDGGAVTMGTGVIIGTCTDMCPPSEREMRAREGDLDSFERVVRQDKHTTSQALAVKRFTRTNARVPALVRTPAALNASIAHLLGILRQHGRTDFKGCYRFVWDRFRAIRVDITMQALGGGATATMYEQMARFHILAANQLCEDAQSVSNPEGFNSHLNVEQLMKCLASLFRIYDDVARRRGQQPGGMTEQECPNEPEFRAYHLLLSLDRHGKYQPDARETADELRKLRPDVLMSRHVRLYLDAAHAYRSCNWHAFFTLAAQRSTHLEACLLSLFFPSARAAALRVINATYGVPGAGGSGDLVPLVPLATATACDEEYMAGVAEHHGLTVIARPEDSALCLMPRDSAFVRPEAEIPLRREPLVTALEPGDLVASIEGPPALPSAERQRVALDLSRGAELAAQRAQAAALKRLQDEQAAAQAAQARAEAERKAQEERQRAEQTALAEAAAAAARTEQEAQRQRGAWPCVLIWWGISRCTTSV